MFCCVVLYVVWWLIWRDFFFFFFFEIFNVVYFVSFSFFPFSFFLFCRSPFFFLVFVYLVIIFYFWRDGLTFFFSSIPSPPTSSPPSLLPSLPPSCHVVSCRVMLGPLFIFILTGILLFSCSLFFFLFGFWKKMSTTLNGYN